MTLGPRAPIRAADFSTDFGDNRRDAGHTPVPHELEHAYRTAKTLAEQLEVANQVVLQRLALYIRGQIAKELAALGGEAES